jgi:hypothetical protein
MATLTNRRDSSSTLDPHLFPFKPKLNEKSNQIAEKLLSDFYERQLKHVQRLQEIVSVVKDKKVKLEIRIVEKRS